MYTVMVF